MQKNILTTLVGLGFLAACNANENDSLIPVTFQTSGGAVVYRMETALTRDEMAVGLMNRKDLRADSGMVFNIGGVPTMAMWMQNTYIPLDMIFLNQDKEITWIHENAVPLSTELIRPQTLEPIYAVIEVNAGDVQKHNIAIGDKVEYELPINRKD